MSQKEDLNLPLTSDEYVECHGNKYPKCRSKNLEGVSMEFSGDGAYQV
jgi:hypothetical protein